MCVCVGGRDDGRGSNKESVCVCVCVGLLYHLTLQIGSSVCDSLFKLIATLLVLKCLSTLTSHSFRIVFSPKVTLSEYPVKPVEFQSHVVKAINFVAAMDRRFPSLYTRLELGNSWEEILNHPAGKLF